VTTLENDSARLNSDNSLVGDVTSMQQAYGQEEQQYRAEQSGSCDVMGGDADDVGGDADDVGGDLIDLQASVSYLNSQKVRAVKNDLAAVQGEVSTLQGLGAAPGTDYSAVVAAGNQAPKPGRSLLWRRTSPPRTVAANRCVLLGSYATVGSQPRQCGAAE
jgi:hypothetical protein